MSDQSKISFDKLIRKGLCAHASSVGVLGKAIIFIGHSTSGKSTIVQILSGRYEIIADDKIWIQHSRDSNWIIRDASDNYQIRKGDEHYVGRKKYPLCAIFRIFKSESTRSVPLSSRTTCKYLMDSVFEIDFQRKIKDLKLKKQWFVFMADMARNIGGWELTFAKDVSILNKMQDLFETNDFMNNEKRSGYGKN